MPQPFIMVAPNGARRGKADHPMLPITIDEIVQTAQECFSVGADALHLHIRDDNGEHSLDSGLYREHLEALHQAIPQMPVQITTEAAGIYEVEAQLQCLEALRPQWASVSIREIAREKELAERLYHGSKEAGTEIQHIFYDADDVELFLEWKKLGIIPADPASALFVLGRYSQDQNSSPSDLIEFMGYASEFTKWMVCAFGAGEHECLRDAAKRGGDVRVGFENSLHPEQGEQWTSNNASVSALRAQL